MKTTRLLPRTRWPELPRRPLNLEPTSLRLPSARPAAHDFLVLNPRPDLLNLEPAFHFQTYPVDLP
jgi:hypothetical protein